MKSLIQMLATIAFCGGVFSHAFSYMRPLKTDTPVAAVYPDQPDTKLSPGDVRTTDLAVITNTRTRTVRDVPQSEKDAVYREYGLDPRHHQPCEIDHLISLELGGSNDIKNLWPEHYSQPNGAHQKDVLENRLHALVVSKQITVVQAQHDIAMDWIAAYKKYMPQSASQN